jgi:hypothetical protein
VVPSSAPAAAGTSGRCGRGCGYPVAEHVPRACAGVPADDAAVRVGSTHANLRVRESLRCPPSRRVPHKWSGRRPDRYMGREAAFRSERGGLSEQRGWAPKALLRDVCAPEGSAPLSPRPPRREPLITGTREASEATPSASPEFRDEPKKNPPLPGERRVRSYLLLTEPERSKPEPEQPCRQQPERSWQQPERRQPEQQPERPEPWQQQPGQRPG